MSQPNPQPLDHHHSSSVPLQSVQDWKKLASTYWSQKKWSQALDAFSKSIELGELEDSAELPLLYSNRSATYFQLGSFEEGLQDAERCISKKPGWPKGYFRKGKCLLELKRYSEAKEAFLHAKDMEIQSTTSISSSSSTASISSASSTSSAVLDELDSLYQTAHIKEYYSTLDPKGMMRIDGLDTCEVKYINKTKGKGLFATQDLQPEQLLLSEPLLVSVQYPSNKAHALACEHCLRFVGSLSHQLDLILGPFLHKLPKGLVQLTKQKPNKWNLGLEEQCSPLWVVSSEDSDETAASQFNGMIPCESKCGEAYCSDKCRKAALRLYHNRLCHSRFGFVQNSPLKQYERYAIENSDRFLLIAKIVAMIMNRYESLKEERKHTSEHSQPSDSSDNQPSQSSSKGPEEADSEELFTEASKQFNMYISSDWESIEVWDEKEQRYIDERPLKLNLLNTSSSLLREALFTPETDPILQKLFTPQYFSRLMGLIELNSQNIGVLSPLHRYFRALGEASDVTTPGKAEALKQFQSIIDSLFKYHSEVPNCQGVGLSLIQSNINHSCIPNSELAKTNRDYDARSTVIALSPIKKGEEITISYIPFDEGEYTTEQRRRELFGQYRFHCVCPKCQSNS